METIRTNLVKQPDLAAEFVRLNWTSSQAREVWESVFQECSSLFQWLEGESVKYGLRDICLQICPADKLDEFTQKKTLEGLFVAPVDKVQLSDIYSSSASLVDLNRPWGYKLAIGQPKEVSRMVLAYKAGDHEQIGELLGYPLCCISFFNKIWTNDSWLDTSFPMSSGVVDHFAVSPFNNILLRWLGLRFVSHLPCSFDCPHTRRVGELYYNLALRLGRRTFADLLKEILSWPIEWSGLHGIAIISTPVCRIVVRTDMLSEKKIVRLHSNTGPKEAATGLKFPYLKTSPQDNGFRDKQSEIDAHNLILDLLRIQPFTSVIDFGCGNGELLRKLEKEFGAEIFGVDSDPKNRPHLAANIWSLDDLPDNFDLALISRARLLENPEGWTKLRAILERRCRFLVIYSYNGNIEPVEIGSFRHALGVSKGPNIADYFVYDKTPNFDAI
jgi:hypothetical protein